MDNLFRIPLSLLHCVVILAYLIDGSHSIFLLNRPFHWITVHHFGGIKSKRSTSDTDIKSDVGSCDIITMTIPHLEKQMETKSVLAIILSFIFFTGEKN
jgi:hypothetical protein